MEGLCEGGNEPSGSLKAILAAGEYASSSSLLHDDTLLTRYPFQRVLTTTGVERTVEERIVQEAGTAPRFTQPPIKLSTGSFPGVKDGQSVVPTTPPHSSAEVMESMRLYLHLPQVQRHILVRAEPDIVTLWPKVRAPLRRSLADRLPCGSVARLLQSKQTRLPRLSAERGDWQT
ncbi:hypothetical protein ANN_21861 [Periplaneta americana]|uniref:Uncharacterized protein n=1 Tax=Periplaneta americana TaxID=6978 RepID=A0ABQ8S7E3_PERAM|nr:hypothetical protein ANN_21861 [Periplaneta americana]